MGCSLGLAGVPQMIDLLLGFAANRGSPLAEVVGIQLGPSQFPKDLWAFVLDCRSTMLDWLGLRLLGL